MLSKVQIQHLNEKTAQIDRALAHTEQQIALLAEYRTALISAAITGKVDVRDDRLSQPPGTTLPATLAGIPVSQMPPRPSEAGSV